MSPFRLLAVFGTRPEAIKLCPLIRRLQSLPRKFAVRTCVTAQHRAMLDQVLDAFEVKPDHDLDLMREGQTLYETTSRVLAGLEPVLKEENPEMVLVQGDTTTTLAASLAAFYGKIPIGHVEAGLRTGWKYSPFPEEMNRVLTTRLADMHFAATTPAADNLRQEGVPAERIVVTGNTVIDAVLYVRDALAAGKLSVPQWPFPEPGRKLVLVTAHRRESFGEGFERICRALKELAEREDIELAYPLHPNPNVAGPVRRMLGGVPRIHLLEPLDYTPFIDLMTRSHLILTDSGGIQEEAPSLAKPVLVLRENTERPEAIQAGTARLVGTDALKIVQEAGRLLDNSNHYERMSQRHNPYGDGRACERIVAALERYAERAASAALASR